MIILSSIIQMIIRKFSIFTAIAVLGFGCIKYNSPQEESQADLMVMRVNLDDKPNMIALPLSEDIYAAYDGKQGSLYKVWKGTVKLTGPVYDNLHGPQPFSEGEAYIDERSAKWSLTTNGKKEELESQFKSYKIKDNSVTLMHELSLSNGKKVYVQETPQYDETENGVSFERMFQTSGVPEASELYLDMSFKHLVSQSAIETDGELFDNDLDSESYEWGESASGGVTLKLNANATTSVRAFLQAEATAHVVIEDTPEQEVELNDDKPVEDEIIPDNIEALVSVGKQILGNNDCAACHQMDKQVIGPSYTMIAQKYPSNLETVNLLSTKIISGGSGVWGQQAMSAHPNVSENHAKAMAAYILSVVPDDESSYQAGIAVDFYDIAQPLPSLPEVVAGQNPNLSVVYPSVDFRSGNPDIGLATDENFSGFVKDFVMEVNGFLNVDESREYQFMFIANNGGKITINNEVLSEGHFYEGTFEDEFSVDLKKGANPFKINFYHHLFDKYLILLWRENEDQEYEPVPASVFTHNPFDIKPTSSGVKSIISNKAPGFGASLEEIHPAFTLSEVRPQGFEPRVGDMEFRENGNMVLCTWDGEVYEMENVTTGKTAATSARKIATGLCEPLGITEVDGEIYVLQRWELTKLLDNDDDGIIDEFVSIATFGSNAQFHEWSFGLVYKDDHFYCTTGIAMGRNAENMHVDRGKALKISMDGTIEHVAYGLKEPNGIGIGPDNEIFVADNEGEWQPVCKIFHIPQEGKPFYGNKSVEADNLPEDIKDVPPVIWLPQNEIGNSPSQPILMKHGPYEGQMIHGEITHGGIKRDFIEKVKGQYQGAVFRFTQGLEVGINRIEWGPDEALYASGLGGAQDFGWKGTQFGLQRLTYNGNVPFEMLAIRAKANGLEVEFTKPLRAGVGTQTEDYKVQQWYYTWTEEGESQQKRELENLIITSVSISQDRKKVFLELPGIKEEHVLYVQLQPMFLSEENEQLWTNEGWYTLNKKPDESGIVNPYPHDRVANQLSPAEIEDGWNLLFEGESSENWKTSSAESWKVSSGNMQSDKNGSLTTIETGSTNYELEFEWKISPGTSGGILFHIPSEVNNDDMLAVSPRYQIIDDATEEAKNIHTRKSGANFDMQAPLHVVTNPTNEYNFGRLVVRDDYVEQWVNGVLVTSYTIGSEEWNNGLSSSAYSGSYAQNRSDGIALYNEKGEISFRNIKIRAL